ncbi:GNAT family N-acetyltransferase [Allosalinactinospora lopnorensis]|uniref:GNAT family N-acetyltransferase n=1 Tax=Allosalinactinospora lopnorensis TaxID=1352348 RepID=UPI000623FEE3|nr:GNAT family N-acetyltransferase [Allosalinactinospora lopnorensis]
MSRSHTARTDDAATWSPGPIDDDRFAAFARLCAEALNSHNASVERLEHYRAITDLDRTLAVFDGEQMVGTAVAHSFTMTLPGGQRPVAGVSGVGVWPTHRRRGILSALMRRQLADIRERGEAVAALFASEGGIYGRFGYGSASASAMITLRRGEAALRPDLPRDPGLQLRLASPGEVRDELSLVHQAAASTLVGEFARDKARWDLLLSGEERDRAGFSSLKCALAEDGTGPSGYALYRIRQQWDDHGVADCPLRVDQLYATTPAAHALLWEHVLTRDLVSTVSTALRPLDDPLFHLLSDKYPARSRLTDGLWIRLVDLPAALEQRSYAAPVDVVIEATDTYCPWNAGRWRLAADTGSAHCTMTDAEPDIRLDVSHLGAAYLGDTRLSSHLAAGSLTEETAGAAQRLDTALSLPTRPFCGVIF